MKTSGFRGSLELSATLRPSQNIQRPCDASAAFSDSGNGAANISSEQDSSKRSTPDLILWRFWDAGYERSYHGAPAIVDLGEI
ncbi:MAG: hypothetical protein WCF88_14600 [Candidatus Acidiferrales bacterium]